MVDDERPQSEVAAESPVFVATRPARSPGDALHRLDEVLQEAVARRVFPGAAVACGSCDYPASSGLQYFSKGMSPSRSVSLSNPRVWDRRNEVHVGGFSTALVEGRTGCIAKRLCVSEITRRRLTVLALS
jgi:hypothetical protein